MTLIKKTLFPKNLSNYSVLVNDTDPSSKYFKISELPDTFTGGKNAFLIAGSEQLVPDTKIQIEIKDSAGNIIYNEPGEGMISSSINGESFITEYYEGVSKVVAVYIYPDTAYGPCTLTILGELSEYTDINGITNVVPMEWENKYNVKWEKQINVNPALPNTTKIRFYQRPKASITEILSPIYRIESGSKYNSGVSQSFAEIKLSQLETFAGDVKRVKVFRTSQGDISDYDLIQDILVESKELLTSYDLSGSVVGETGILTSETLQKYWNTGSLKTELTSSRVESGVKLSGSGYFTYTSSLDIKSANAYELNLDAFYSSSTSSNLGVYLSYVSQSTTFTSSIATLYGTQPTKNLLDTVIPFQITKDYPSASLYFSQSNGEWHLGNISLKLSQDTAFSPDEISFITTMPTIIGNETYNFKFEFYDVNNNYVPVFVTGSGTFTGGNTGQLLRSLTFDSDRTAFRFSTGSFGNPAFQQLGFKVSKQNLTGSVTYGRSVYDTSGNYISPASYGGTYPGTLTNSSDAGATLTIANFSGSVSSILVGSIVYTASCDGIEQYETIYRFEDGDNAPGVFVTANTNQFIYKATDLSLNPTGQVITIEAKRKNLASATTPLTVNSGSGKPGLTFVSTNATNGVDTYTLAGSSYPYSTGETIYYVSGSDQFGNEFSDSIKISPVKILDGFSVAVSNENTSFPAYSTGTVFGGFAASSGSITVKVGTEVINYSSTFVTNSFSASIASTTNLTTNSFDGTNYSISALSADSGSLTLLVKYKDGDGTIISSSKEITYSKVKRAAPILNFIIGNNNQSVTAKSTGTQIDSFLTASFSVLETYNGLTTTKSLTISEINTTNSYVTGSTTSTTLALPTMSLSNNSVDITITGSVVDSESTTRNVYGNISLAKVKKAAPVTLALLSSETQTILSSSAGYAAPATFTITVTEGGSNYSYSTGGAINTYQVSAITGGTNSSGTITPTTPSTNTGTTVNLTITYVNSEGTTGTITKSHKVAVSLAGTNGVNGADGGLGPGVVYRGDWAPNTIYYSSSIRVDVVRGDDSQYYYAKTAHTSSATGVTDKPITGTSYTTYWNSFGATFSSVATDILLAQDATITRGLVMGTYGATDKGFIRSANASALMTGKGYYLDTTGSMRFGDPAGDYVKFTESEGLIINGKITVTGGNLGSQLSTLGTTTGSLQSQLGTVGTATSSLQSQLGTIGGSSGSWINPSSYSFGPAGDAGFDLAAIAPGSTAGLYIGSSYLGYHNGTNWKTYMQDNGNFFLAGSGNNGLTWNGSALSIDGDITARNGTFIGNITSTANITGGTITGGLITGGSINGGGITGSIVSASSFIGATGTFSGTLTSTNATLGGWTIDSSSIFVPNAITLNSSNKSITIYDSTPTPRVSMNQNTSFTNLNSGIPTTLTVSNQNNTAGAPYSPGAQSSRNVGTFTLTSGQSYNITATWTQANGTTAFTLTSGQSAPYSITCITTFYMTDGTTTYTIGSYQDGVSLGTSVGWGDINGKVKNIVVNGNGNTWTVYQQFTWGYTGPGSKTGASYNNPAATVVASQITSLVEVIAGGIQVGRDSSNYVKMNRVSGTDMLEVGGSGTFTGDVTANTSDKRLKENIRIIENPIEKLSKINGVYYTWNSLAKQLANKNTEIEEVGLLAQEVQSVLPHIIKPAPFDKINETGESKSGENYLTIQYEKLVPLLVEAIKELKKEVDELKNSR